MGRLGTGNTRTADSSRNSKKGNDLLDASQRFMRGYIVGSSLMRHKLRHRVAGPPLDPTNVLSRRRHPPRI